MLEELTKTLNPRLMLMLLVAVAVVLVTSSYASLFKMPMKAYKSQQMKYESLILLPSDPTAGQKEIASLKNEISTLNQRLTKAGREIIKGTKPLSVIADLGRYAKQYEVQLLNVVPGKASNGETYTQVPFQVEVSGSYGQLFKWVYSLEHATTPLFVKRFTLKPGTNVDQRELKLQLALIQPLQEE